MSRFAHRFLVFRALLWMAAAYLPTLATAQGVGPARAYALVYDFRDDWQVFDRAYGTYVPYGRDRHAQYGAFSLFLDLKRFRPYRLLFRSDDATYLFINARLQRQLPVGTWYTLSLDSLYQVHRAPQVLLTFFGEAPTPDRLRVLIGQPLPPGAPAPAASETLLQVRPRALTAFETFSSLAVLLIAAYGAFLYTAYHRTFVRYFSVRDLLTINPREASMAAGRGLLEPNHLLMVVLQSFVLAYVYLLVQHRNIDLFSTQALLSRGQTLGELGLDYLGATLLIFSLYLLKYLALIVLGSLYQFERLINVHYVKLIQATLLFFSGVALVLTVLIHSFPRVLLHREEVLLVPVLIFFLLRLALLYFTINKLASTKNLYLFSYLCIVELIPLIVGVRFAL